MLQKYEQENASSSHLEACYGALQVDPALISSELQSVAKGYLFKRALVYHSLALLAKQARARNKYLQPLGLVHTYFRRPQADGSKCVQDFQSMLAQLKKGASVDPKRLNSQWAKVLQEFQPNQKPKENPEDIDQSVTSYLTQQRLLAEQ